MDIPDKDHWLLAMNEGWTARKSGAKRSLHGGSTTGSSIWTVSLSDTRLGWSLNVSHKRPASTV